MQDIMVENKEMRKSEENISAKPRKKSGKDRTCKSEEIATTPTRSSKGAGAVTPGNQPISKREQQSSKKKWEEQKRTMEQYFGKGERVQPPSKGGTPIQSILLKRLTNMTVRSTEQENSAGTKPDNIGEGSTAVTDHMEVDLEGFTPGVCPKGNRSKKRDYKGKEERTEVQVRQTKARKPTIAFGPTEVAKEKPTYTRNASSALRSESTKETTPNKHLARS